MDSNGSLDGETGMIGSWIGGIGIVGFWIEGDGGNRTCDGGSKGVGS